MSAIKIFQREMVGSARRAGYYRLRMACLCAMAWLVYVIARNQTGLWSVDAYGFPSRPELRMMAQTSLIVTIIGLIFVVLSITPSLMAGVVVEEKQQRTLQELLTTRLSPWEILFAKLISQWMQAGVLVSLGLPLILLSAPCSGASPELLFLIVLVLFTTCYLVGGMGILASTIGRRLSEAIFVAYALTVIWLVLPPVLIDSLMRIAPSPWPEVRAAISPWTCWISWSSPLSLWGEWNQLVEQGPDVLTERVRLMVGLQLAFGTMFLLAASALLRPTHARQQAIEHGTARRWNLRSKGFRLFPKPTCGDDPLFWKERCLAKSGGVAKLVTGLIVTLGALQLLVIVFRYYYGYAITEAIQEGYFNADAFQARERFNHFLRNSGRVLALIWLVAVAMNLTDGWIRERLQDTWISLISTPLTGAEILKGKLLGSIARIQGLGYALLAFFAFGTTTGAIHPLGFLLIVLELIALTWVIAVACTYFFIDFKAKAGTLLLTGLAFFLLALAGQKYPYLGYLVKPDYVILAATLSVADLQNLAQGLPIHQSPRIYDIALDAANPIKGCLISLATYAMVALGLTWTLFRNFDAMIGRPVTPSSKCTALCQ